MIEPHTLSREELNQAIAKLAGFVCPNHIAGLCNGTQRIKCMACGAIGHGNCYLLVDGAVQIPCCTETPDYCGSIEAAWQLVEQMPSPQISAWRGGWMCLVDYIGTIYPIQTVEATAPLAIVAAYYQFKTGARVVLSETSEAAP